MRLFYQTLGMSRGSKSGQYGQLLQSIITGAAAPGTTVDAFGLSPHRAVADQYRYLEFQDTTEVLENGLRAEKEGYDAFLLGNIFQPGLHELRELLNIPVLGLAESTVQMACLMGPTFSLININPKFNRRIVEGVRLQGLDGRMVSVEMMTVERPGVFDLALSDPAVLAGIVDQFTEVARRALDKGAEVLIPAGGSLMAALHRGGLHQVDGAPVLNGIIALVKTAEMAAQMRAITGCFTSKRLVYAPPSGKLLADVRAAYGEGVYPGAT
ncbi:MAG: aspartate/glutamate racemase family protein [Amaricoccus sp.]